MLAEAMAVDAEEDARYGPERRGDELPEGLVQRGERLTRLREAKARLEQEAADGGYLSEAIVTTCTRPDGPELLIATTKDPDWSGRKLLTKRGRALYKTRGILVEPVLGQVKEGQGFRRFMRRGLRAAQSERSLVGATHNLLKLWRSGLAPWGWNKARWN